MRHNARGDADALFILGDDLVGILHHALHVARRLADALLVLHETDAHMPVAIFTEADARRHRHIRLFEQHPQLFRRQIEALLHCVGQCRLAIMVPMISSLREWRAIRAEILQLAQGRKLELGVMIEVPSAALLAEKLAPEVDFFSIGTNDLTQYTLAIDRGHSQLAGEVDALHPAMLQLIQRVGEAAQRHGCWVGVCGGAAQDPDAIPLLLGLNVRELSCSAPAIAAVKAEVRRWSLADCQELARAALECGEAQEVRELVRGRRS